MTADPRLNPDTAVWASTDTGFGDLRLERCPKTRVPLRAEACFRRAAGGHSPGVLGYPVSEL